MNGLVLVYTSRNKQELLIKKHLLESNGIPAEVKLAPEERHTRGWGMPVGMEDLEKLFHLSVPWEAADEAKEILEAVASSGTTPPETGRPAAEGCGTASDGEKAETPLIVLLDPDHRVLAGPEGLPPVAVDEAADPKPFSYLFSYTGDGPGMTEAGPEKDAVYQVFLSTRPAERVRKITEGYAWYGLAEILAGSHPAVDPAGFREMYVEGFLDGFDPPGCVFSAERFGGTPRLADLLLELIREGKKTATSSLLWSFRAEGISPPAAGDITVVLDGGGVPGAVIRTTAVTELPYRDVSPEQARLEGEDDLSLDAWRKGHWKWFSRECKEIGKDPDESMPVVFEEFELLAKL